MTLVDDLRVQLDLPRFLRPDWDTGRAQRVLDELDREGVPTRDELLERFVTAGLVSDAWLYGGMDVLDTSRRVVFQQKRGFREQGPAWGLDAVWGLAVFFPTVLAVREHISSFLGSVVVRWVPSEVRGLEAYGTYLATLGKGPAGMYPGAPVVDDEAGPSMGWMSSELCWRVLGLGFVLVPSAEPASELVVAVPLPLGA